MCSLSIFSAEGLELVFRLVFKTSSGRTTPSVAGSIPALSDSRITINGESDRQSARYHGKFRSIAKHTQH